MKIIISCVTALLTPIIGLSQIINGDFETHIDIFPNPITNASPWQAMEGSSDLHVEGSNNNIGQEGCGGPFARNGIGYAGVGLYRFISPSTSVGYREYIYQETESLTAGAEYYIEFYARDVSANQIISKNIGLYISSTPVNNLFGNDLGQDPFTGGGQQNYGNTQVIYPQVTGTIGGLDNGYELITGCFTATESGNHYIYIGNFEVYEHGEGDCGDGGGYMYVDDISMELTNPNTPEPIVAFTTNDVNYCQSDPMVATITSWSNVQKFRWKIEKINCYTDATIDEWTSDWGYSNPGSLDIDDFWPYGIGSCSCWKLTLQAYNKCQYFEVSHEFQVDCFSSVNLVGPSDPFCEGTEITITNTAGINPDNTYFWSTGDTGASTSVIADGPISVSLTQTTPGGCTQTYNYGLDPGLIFVNPNLAPSITTNQPIDLIVQSGSTINYLIQTNDSYNETVTLTIGNTPSGMNVNPILSPQQSAELSWSVGYNDLGEHSFTVTALDNNGCGSLSSSITFNIKVICGYCPVNIYYENRTEYNNPLPAFTKAGGTIIAGQSIDPNQTDGPVSTGEAEVIFKAETIILDEGFTAGPGFLAVIDPQTCISDCEDCCDHFTGIHVEEPLPNVFTPNGDGYNDYWNVVDYSNTECAYGAADRYQLNIWGQWGNLIYSKDQDYDHCCSMKSYYPGGPRNRSTIHWNGHKNQGNNNLVSDGTYYYWLKIHSCNGTFVEYTGHITVAGTNGMIMEDEGIFDESNPATKGDPALIDESLIITAEETNTVVNQWIAPEQSVFLFPNPALDFTNLIITNFDITDNHDLMYIVYDINGKKYTEDKISNYSTKIDTNNLAKGNYFVAVEKNQKNLFNLNFIKK